MKALISSIYIEIATYRALLQGVANVQHAHHVTRNEARGWQKEPQVCRRCSTNNQYSTKTEMPVSYCTY